MKKNSSRILIITAVGLSFLTSILGVGGNLLTSNKDVAEWVDKNLLGTTGLIIGVSVVVLLVSFLTYLYSKYSLASEPAKELQESPAEVPGTEETTNPFQLQRRAIIKYLLERYTDQRNQKLDGRIPLRVVLQYTDRGTSRAFSEKYFDAEVRGKKEIRLPLTQVWEKHRYLLLLGDPGVGKSTQLLELAINLLEKAKRTSSLPIPVIFTLRSWKGGDFAVELMAQLRQGHGFHRELALEAFKGRLILPILDGLDEIENNSLRSACLRSIEQFLNTYEPERLLICSRIDEYEETPDDAPVSVPVEIKPLKPVEVSSVLKNLVDNPQRDKRRPYANKTAAQNITSLMKGSEMFAKTVSIPLYFNLASTVFTHRSQEHEIPTDKKAIEEFLVSEFVEGQLASRSTEFPKHDQNRSRLSWLAHFLVHHDEPSIELTIFQPQHLRNPRLYSVINAILSGSVFGISLGIFAGGLIALTNGVSSGLYYGPLLSLLMSLVVIGVLLVHNLIRTKSATIWTREIRVRRWSELISKKGLLFVLFFSPITFLGGWLVGNVSIGLVFLMFFLITFVDEKTTLIAQFSAIEHPYQRLKQGLLPITLRMALIFALSLPILYFFNDSFRTSLMSTLHLSQSVSSGLMVASVVFIFLFGLITGLVLNPMYDHLILRLCFYLEGAMPLRYVDFLNYATDMRLLERVGGGWRFRHQRLQEYFIEVGREKLIRAD